MVIRNLKQLSLFLFLLFMFSVRLAAQQKSQTFALPPAHFVKTYPPFSLNAAEEDYAAQAQQLYTIYDMSPPSGIPGRAYSVNIISHDPTKKQITDKTQIVAPGGISISDVALIGNNGLSAKITIPEDIPLGRIQFLLKDKEGASGTIIGVSEFEVTSIAQGPTPPGLSPEVDVMWGVMARDVVKHNFGTKIAKHYYGIQLSIGNNTGFDLQIASVGFKLPANTKIKNTVPTNSYRSTRGTLEREQEIGTRAMVVNAVKAAGLLFTGFLPFWHAVGPAANATRFADIINGPANAGLALVYPDTIISHLTRLDDQTLRDGLIIKNNSQVRTLVFVPKQLLNISQDEGRTDTDQKRYHAETKNVDYRNDPQYVNLRLGDLVLVGQPIKYLNRIQVIKTSEGGPVAPSPTVVGINPPSVEQGSDHESLIIPGSYLDNAVLTLKDPDTNDTVVGVKFSDISSDSSGHILKAKVTVDDNVPPKKYRLIVSSPGGSVETTLEIIQAPPSELGEISYLDGHPPTANANEDVEVKIKITGKHLENSEVVVPVESKGKLVAEPDADVEGGELTQTIRLLKGIPPGSYKLQVKNTNPRAVALKNNFLVAAAPK